MSSGRLLGLSGAGEILHDDEFMQRFAVEAIARALGASRADSAIPPKGLRVPRVTD